MGFPIRGSGEIRGSEDATAVEVVADRGGEDAADRGADQVFAIEKPSGDLGFVYSDALGEFIEITYSEAWFRIYTSQPLPTA